LYNKIAAKPSWFGREKKKNICTNDQGLKVWKQFASNFGIKETYLNRELKELKWLGFL